MYSSQLERDISYIILPSLKKNFLPFKIIEECEARLYNKRVAQAEDKFHSKAKVTTSIMDKVGKFVWKNDEIVPAGKQICDLIMSKTYWQPIAIFAGLSAVSFVGVPLALNLIGFTGIGVKAGTVAAFIHAKIGNVVAGSIFAHCQHLGAVGVLKYAAYIIPFEALAVACLYPAIKYVGFTGAGVTAGAVAAYIHSEIGNVVAGNVSAHCQHLGAVGMLACAAYIVPTNVATVTGMYLARQFYPVLKSTIFSSFHYGKKVY